MAEDRITAALRGNPTTPSAMNQQGGRPFRFPPDHQPGMQVPPGGSACSKCKYLSDDGDDCTNQYFIEWNGSPDLPAPADQYCSDWFEPRDNEMPIDEGTEVSEGANQ